jgi:hypothetical protein
MLLVSGDRKPKQPSREKYTVGDLIDDLKAIEPTPSILYKIGSEIVYNQWACCGEKFGADNPVTSGLSQLLEFMQGGYEQRLVRGELWRATDTPKAAIDQVEKTLTREVLDCEFERPRQYIQEVLQSAHEQQLHDLKDYERLEQGMRSEIEASPDDPDNYNKLRLLLWVLGRYKESSQVLKMAKKLGWKPETSELVAI